MQCEDVDRVLRAIALVVQVEERFPYPRYISGPQPIVLIKEAEQRSVATRCMACGSDDILVEQHHIAGGSNFRDTITLCEECHDELSNIYQPKWLPWKDSKRNPLECYLLGWSDVFHLMWQRTKHQYFHELSKAFALNARYAR